MNARDLESLLVQAVSGANHPKIGSVKTLAEDGSSKIGIQVDFTDRSAVFCKFVQVLDANGRPAHSKDYEIPEGM